MGLTADPVRGRIVLFGGMCPPRTDTWELDASGWGPGANPAPPTMRARALPASAYLERAGGPVIFGGYGDVLAMNDVWEYPCLALSPEGGLPDGSLGQPYAASIVATGGSGLHTFQLVEGSLPPSVTLSTAGQLTGIPARAGRSTFSVYATDASSCGSTEPFTILVDAAPLVIGPASLRPGRVGSPYSATLLSGGTPPLQFRTMAGRLPPGLSLSSSGVIAGVPSSPGTYKLRVQVVDDVGRRGTLKCKIHVAW